MPMTRVLEPQDRADILDDIAKLRQLLADAENAPYDRITDERAWTRTCDALRDEIVELERVVA